MKIFKYLFLLILTISLTGAVHNITVTGDNCNPTNLGDRLMTVGPGCTIDIPTGNKAPTSVKLSLSCAEGETCTLDGSTSSDSDGTISSYLWNQECCTVGNCGATVSLTNANTSISTFTTSTYGDQLCFFLTVTDNDGGKEIGTAKVTTTAPTGNVPPNAVTAADFNADEQTSVNLVGTASNDSDGTIDAYSWVQMSGPAVILSNDSTSTASFTAPDIGSDTILVFRLAVTDNDLSSDTDTISITINPIEETPYEIAREASRTSGVAPLSVFFTAGFNSSSPINRDFHDLEYSWDFDDSGSGTWGTSGKSKNIDKGPVSSHVFESAGTYTVALTVKNAGGTIDTDTFVITVTDPDTVFSGTNTTCISSVAEADFTGCPSGATEITSDDLDNITTYIGSGKRVLLDRGSTWSQSGSITIPTLTTAQLGAYGTGTSPDSQGIFTNAPLINVTGTAALFPLSGGKQDLRITDITFSGAATVLAIATGGTDWHQTLMMRLKTSGFNNVFELGHSRNNDSERIAENSIVLCDIGDFDRHGIYIGSEKLSLMGNIVYNSDTAHIIRIWWARQSVIGHNIISGSSLTDSSGKHGLKLHSPKESQIGTFAETGSGGLATPTKYVHIANNVFGSSGPTPVSIGPQDNVSNENISDVILEKNKTIAGYGNSSSTLPASGLWIAGRYNTARNNIVDGTSARGGYTGIAIERRGIEDTPLGIHLYNNTVYNNGTIINNARGFTIVSSATKTVIKNNFVSFPSATGTKTLIIDSSTDLIESNNLLSDTNGFTDPNNVTPLLRDFTLTLGAPAINQGTTVPVLDDFNNAVRATIYELGAYQY